MASVKNAYGTADQSVTITFNSLTCATARQSTVVDNSSNLYTDAIVQVDTKAGTSTPSSDKAVYVYVYATTGGTTYPEGLTGSDAAYSIKTPCNLKLAAVICETTAAETLTVQFSLASCFGGLMPAKWGVVIYNVTGQALGSTGNTVTYQGVYATVA